MCVSELSKCGEKEGSFLSTRIQNWICQKGIFIVPKIWKEWSSCIVFPGFLKFCRQKKKYSKFKTPSQPILPSLYSSKAPESFLPFSMSLLCWHYRMKFFQKW